MMEFELFFLIEFLVILMSEIKDYYILMVGNYILVEGNLDF